MSKYEPIRKRGPAVDFGYEQDKDDPQLLVPIPDQLDCLMEGLELCRKGCTFREVANWITATTGRYLSHKNLWKKFHEERRRKERDRKREYRAKHYKRVLTNMGYTVDRQTNSEAATPEADDTK